MQHARKGKENREHLCFENLKEKGQFGDLDVTIMLQ
jgi:hypothetical protein